MALCAVAATAIGACAAAPAQAMRTYVDYDSLVISAGPGEANVLTVVPDPQADYETGPAFLITDPGASITAGRGCTRSGFGHTVRCVLSPENRVASLALWLGDKGDAAKVDGSFFYFQVDAGGGNDRLDLVGSQAYSPYGGGSTIVWLGAGADTLKLQESFDGSSEVYGEGGNDDITAGGWVDGGDGDDTLTGRSNTDYLFGSAGDDAIDADDAWFDAVDCGAGTDSMIGDATDTHDGCEKVHVCGDPTQIANIDCTASLAKGFLP
jgi:hypothetical protein